MSIFGGNTHAPKAVLDAARSIMRGEEIEEMSSKEKMKRGLYNSVMIPEEIPTNEKTAFAGAAAAAHKAGKKNFEFQGKTYPVTMQKDAAHAIASEETVQEAVFTPCDGCPDPDKCEAAGKCMKAEEAVDVDAGNVEKALKHDCATHVQHEEHGVGRCIPGMHTLEQVDEENGVVTHYDVMFENDEGPYIVENVPVAEMKVLKDMNHGHKKKKSMGENYAGNYGSSVASYNKERDHADRYEKENPGKKWKDLKWGHQDSLSKHYEKNPE